MSLWRLFWVVAAAGALQGNALAQLPRTAPPATRPGLSFESFPLPPVPDDPLELVTGDAQLVQDAEERAAVLTMLSNARSLSNVRAHPYDLKTTFTSFGSSSSDGSWTLEDISPARDIYRWTAQGPSFSATYLTINKLLSSDQPPEAIPLRVTQAREAIFYVYPEIGPHASLRTATGYLNGLELRCVLVAHNAAAGRPSPRGRSWEESEYCVDPNSGLLATYSPAPGLYIHYDYANALHFHDKIIPGAFTISEAGRPVVEAKTESVSNPPDPNSSLFNPSGLKPLGAGPVMSPAWSIRGFVGRHMNDPNATAQVVVLHGIASPDGQFTEGEVLASTNSSLNEDALNHAKKAPSVFSEDDPQPGATPRSREMIFIVEFVIGAK